jgi:uncharacterized protein (TIGR03435 family)
MTLAALANHVWQSTLFALAVGALTLALRRNRAAVRYALWLASSIKFLIPFDVFESLGSRIPWQSAAATPPVTLAIAQLSQPFTGGMAVMERPAVSADTPWLALIPAVVWLGGVIWVASGWYRSWRRIRAALSAASRLPVEAPVPVLSSPMRLEPGIFGIVRPVLLLPEGIAERLAPAQFQAILSHEFCHVRRRDHRTATIHMLVELLYWFHPLVWWIGARLVDERERACDEEVLGQGSAPEVYAAGILNVCRYYLESSLPCTPGVTGADLRKRIEAIMTERTQVPLTLTRKLLLAAATLAAIAAPIAIGIATATASRAQETDPKLRFEVSSIKPTKNPGGRGGMQVLPGGGLRMDGVTLLSLIAFAYDVREGQITGAPKWAGEEAFNVLAKPEHPTAADDAAPTSGPGNVAWDRVRVRTRNMLVERFHLETHTTAKETSGYALVVAKGGTKLVQSTSQGPPRTMRNIRQIDARNGTMNMLAAVLTGYMGSPVEDRTKLTGSYDYKLEYAPDPGATHMPEAPHESNPAEGPSLLTALQEQLGLKMESARVATRTIVIDKVEKLSAN